MTYVTRIANLDAVIIHALLSHGRGPYDIHMPSLEVRYVRPAELEETRSSAGHLLSGSSRKDLPMGSGRYGSRWVEGK